MFSICSHVGQIGCPPKYQTRSHPMRSPLRPFAFRSPPARPTVRSAATLGSAGGMHRFCVLAPQIGTNNALSNPSSGDRGKPFSPVATQAAQNASRSYSRRSAEAVLLCIFKGGSGELRVILTNRSSNPSSHSGEVWLPGGDVADEDEDVIDAALREAKESYGIDGVNAVCMLHPFHIISEPRLKVVVPVLGTSNRDSFMPVPNKDEVDGIFDAPLQMFLKDDILPLEEHLERGFLSKRDLFTPVLTKDEMHEFWGYPMDMLGRANDCYQSVEDMEDKAHYFDYEIQNKKFLIWGLTARILIRAAFVAYQTQPSFLGCIIQQRISLSHFTRLMKWLEIILDILTVLLQAFN